MHVQVRYEILPAEGIDAGGVALRDVGVAKGAADDHTVLGFDQGVVVAAPGPGLGELGVELVEQVRDTRIDVLAAVDALLNVKYRFGSR